jgi:micrococcal nuclease
MRRITLLLAAVLAGIIALGAAATANAQSKVPCIPGTSAPLCHVQTGKATFISDGDTIEVDIAGDGTGASKSIRFIGINAMELSRYSKYADRRRGVCHGLEAAALVEGYVKRSRWRVRLLSQAPNPTTGHRLRRSVFVKVGGKWTDLAKIVISEGHALWLPNGGEWAHNREYHLLAEQAAAAQKNLWNPAGCGVGPSPDAQLGVSVNWDADGDDNKNLNGEWVDIRNFGAAPVSLAGWWVRDSYLLYNKNHVPGFEFPSYAVIEPGGKARVHMGCGLNTPANPSTFYWCQPDTIFENVSWDRKAAGDGAYLFDPRGNLRKPGMYPCLSNCSDPLAGKVKLRAQPIGLDEMFTIQNLTDVPLDLDGYIVKLHLDGRNDRFIFGYTLGGDSTLAPGETLELHLQGPSSRNSRLAKHLGRNQYALKDSGNKVSLRTTSDIVVDCDAWGNSRC